MNPLAAAEKTSLEKFWDMPLRAGALPFENTQLTRLCFPMCRHIMSAFAQRASVAACCRWTTRTRLPWIEHQVFRLFFACVPLLPQALGSLLRAERPDVEQRRTQMLQLQGEQSVKVSRTWERVNCAASMF